MKKHTVLFYFVCLSGFASFLNYITYPLLARALPDHEFVGITVALSLLTQISSFLSSIVALATGLSKQRGNNTTELIEKLQSVLMQLFMVILVVFLIISPFILDKVRLSAAYLLPICLLMLFSIPISIISGYLTGKSKLIKLAFAAVISATLQFILSIAVGFTTENGALALGAMATGQLIAIFALYIVYKQDKLPEFKSIFRHKFASFRTLSMRSLVLYTIWSSLGIMAVNILQIIDLLIIQNRQLDAKLYTDLYVVSRVVFFAGMIFIWPFLSSIDIYDRTKNIAIFGRLVGLFTLLSAGSIVVLVFFGQEITKLLFDSTYPSHTISSLWVLSITYKYMFLILTALTLFFIVIRSYWSLALPVILVIGSVVFGALLDVRASTMQVLYGLNTLAIFGLVVGGLAFWQSTKKPQSNQNLLS